MLSASDIILEYVCPGAGTITAMLMWVAPWKGVQEATARGRLDDLNPLPWAFMLGNCTGWVTYGILIQNIFVLVANIPGLLMSVYYSMQAIKLQFHEDRSTDLRKSIVSALEVEQEQQSQAFLLPTIPVVTTDDLKVSLPSDKNQNTINDTNNTLLDYAKIVWEVVAQKRLSPAPHEKAVMFMVTLWVATISLVTFTDSFSNSVKENIVGATVIGNLLFFYGAPLSTIATVLKTRNSRSIHVPTMVTNTANGAFWCAYGFAVQDYLIGGPNGVGAFLGGIQIVLCVLFPCGDGSGDKGNDDNDAGDGQPAEGMTADTHLAVDEEKALFKSCQDEVLEIMSKSLQATRRSDTDTADHDSDQDGSW
jgi:solute carrier family 50 protein (sugar transporter)